MSGGLEGRGGSGRGVVVVGGGGGGELWEGRGWVEAGMGVGKVRGGRGKGILCVRACVRGKLRRHHNLCGELSRMVTKRSSAASLQGGRRATCRVR